MTPLPGTAESYWIDSTEASSYPPLTDDVEVDVAVVGGGIAGICSAWELTNRGASVVLLEANRLATGVTGYTTAKRSALHTLIHARLRESHGPATPRRYEQSQRDAAEHAANSAEQLGIDRGRERASA